MGRLTISAQGQVTASDDGQDPNRRRMAGAVGGSVFVDQSGSNTGALQPGLVLGGATSGEGIASRRSSGPNQYGLDLFTAGAQRLSITNTGSVGIGTTAPGAKLHLTGGDAWFGNNLVVGAGGVGGHLRVRHIDGKDYQSDNLDTLFIQWDTGKGVWINRPETPAGLQVGHNFRLRVSGQ